MFNKTLLFLFVCLPLLFNCAAHHQPENSRILSSHYLIPVYRTGLDVKEAQGGLSIESVDADSPAKDAGIQPEDLIVAVNGNRISHKEFLKLMQLNRGEDVHFAVNRYNEILDFTITPKLYFNSPPSVYMIYELSVIDEQKVNLAVIVTDVKNNTSEDNYSWEENTRNQLQRDIENNVLNNLDSQDGVSFVDRSRLEEIIDGYKMNMTGLISDNARATIGKTTGATHILATTFARNPKKVNDTESCEDTITGRLMEVGSGKVLAVDQSTSDCKPAFLYTYSKR
ncbi:MAG TPA: PDZ domain-containing protein [Nitrospirota bacterium]|nr:PDZ domain-containing protein [Nitrospirota bacterium]